MPCLVGWSYVGETVVTSTESATPIFHDDMTSVTDGHAAEVGGVNVVVNGSPTLDGTENVLFGSSGDTFELTTASLSTIGFADRRIGTIVVKIDLDSDLDRVQGATRRFWAGANGTAEYMDFSHNYDAVSFRYRNNYGDTTSIGTANDSVPLDAGTHTIVFTWDIAGEQAKVTVDGSSVTLATENYGTDNGATDNSYPLQFGNFGEDISPVADIKIYDTYDAVQE